MFIIFHLSHKDSKVPRKKATCYDFNNLNMIHTKLQAWVYQGKEPAHFLQIFKGRMITYIGSATDYDRKFTSYIILIT